MRTSVTAESSTPTPLRVMKPPSRAPELPSVAVSLALALLAAGLPMSTARRVNMEAIIKMSPDIPTIMKVSRHPNLTANSPATSGASIFPRSPAKLTVPTAVARPLSS